MNGTAKILVVDDNPEIHDILGKLFKSRGEDSEIPLFLHADNGKTGLDVLSANPDIDVIILDLNMPVMDGFTFLEHVRADLRFRMIPVCVFSGNREDSTKALSLGAQDFINKPGDYMEIKLRVLNLVESKRRAEASERAKKDFLANVSHELRTPMHGVMGMMELMRTTELTTEQSEYIELLEQSAHNMMSMVDSVLNFLQSENPLHLLPVVPFSLRVLVQESIDRLAPEVKINGVTLAVDIHPDLPDNLTGLPDKIQLVFHHLLSNAIKFSPSGKVSVSIAPGTREETSVQLRCSVTDTGIGIPPENQSSIFEPFLQGDSSSTRKFGGLGIGLSIASRVVQMMGGSIHVESSPGGGSTFRFAITCAIDPAVQIADAENILTSD